MSFPSSPVNGQLATLNGISYVYAAATNSWTRSQFTNVTFGGNATILTNTISTSTATGALVVAGGAGVAGALYIANTGDVSANIGAFRAFANANAASQQNQITGANTNIQTTSANLGAFQTYANTKIGTNTNSNLVVVATTTSTSTTTGALVVSGGVGIGGNLSVGGTISANVSGNIRAPIGSITSPSYSFDISPNTGMYLSSSFDFLRFVRQGVDAFIINTSGPFSLRPHQFVDGSAQFPSVASGSWASTGIYFPSAGNVSISSTGSTVAAAFTATNTQIFSRLTVANSTASTSTTTGALVVSGGVGVAGNIELGTNLDLTGTGARITGDFSNATIANRVAFQTSTTDGATTIMALPNGVGINSQLLLRSSSSATNDSFGQVVLSGGTEFRIASGASGTGTNLPMTFHTGGSERVKIDQTAGNVVIVPTTTSTSTTTGALVVGGGAGIGGALNVGGNISLSGTSRRFVANMSSTTQSERFAFQTSALNDNTNIIGIPNGTSVQTTWQAFGNSDPNNAHRIFFGTTNTTDTRIVSDAVGTANVRPMVFVVGATEVLRLDTNARCILGANSTVGASTAALQVVQSGSAGVSIASSTVPLSTGSFSGIDGWANDGAAYFAGATINFRAAENWSATNHGSLIQFRTTPAGAGGTLTERVRIESTGNVVVTGGWIIPSGNVSQNIGSPTAWWNLVYGRSIQAQYADLAENYISDTDYPPGTVVVFGGEQEVTTTTTSHDTRVAGVVSTDPAYLMNAVQGNCAVALTGRVPCLVQGPVKKGTVLVTAPTPGIARALIVSMYSPGCVIGKSLETIIDSSTRLIEVAVGRF